MSSPKLGDGRDVAAAIREGAVTITAELRAAPPSWRLLGPTPDGHGPLTAWRPLTLRTALERLATEPRR